jgi:hypothetical protein
MACFLVSTVEAVVVEAAKKTEKKKDKQEVTGKNKAAVIPLSIKLAWLRNMLLGGSFLLAFEHIWHGEVVPWFPFLTAMRNPDDTAAMLHEISTIGVGMAVLVTVVWFIICKAADALLARQLKNGGAAA